LWLLDGEIVDDGLDTCDLGGVGGGERAGGFAADIAVEGGDGVLHRGLNGFSAEGAVSGEAALHGGSEGGVIGGRRRALAGGEAEGDGEGRVDDEGAYGGQLEVIA